MINRLGHIGLTIGLLLLPGLLAAQEVAPTQVVSPEVAELKLEIDARFAQFRDELNQLYAVSQIPLSVEGETGVSESILSALEQRMKYLNLSYNALDVKWNTYYQAQQMDIANDEDLMNQVASIEELKQTVKDSLDVRTQAIESLIKFSEADKFIFSKVMVYKTLYRKAYGLSLNQKLAPQLEKVKAKEQTIFTDLQANYDQAKAACGVVPALSKRMAVIEEQFVIMKSVSEKVQALEYKPFLQRIKDYLLGLAAVAIVLMFINGMTAKFNAYRAKVANLKKYKDLMDNQGNGTNYPTI